MATSNFEAGGLGQSLKVPLSSSWNWCSQQDEPTLTQRVDLLGRCASSQWTKLLSRSFLLSSACSLRTWMVLCIPLEFSKLNLSLSSPPLANSSSIITLLFFGVSHLPRPLISFLPSPEFCVFSVWAQLRLLQETHREGTKVRSWLQVPTHT